MHKQFKVKILVLEWDTKEVPADIQPADGRQVSQVSTTK